jgi:ABC-2 type transport system permease protein
MPIFDQGYQHWKGRLTGHAWRWLAIARHGMRTQFKPWYVRLLIFIAWMPALILVGALAIWGLIEQGVLGAESWMPFLTMLASASDLHACRQAVWTICYSVFFRVDLFFIMLIVTVAGPNLISRDLRFNALPLYLSRPLTRYDYFLGKLGMIGGIVALVAVLPAVLAYALGACFSLDLSVVRDTWRLLPASIIYGLVIVVSAGTLMLALSSLSRRSLYVSLAWIGIWIISGAVSFALDAIHMVMVVRDVQEKQMREELSVPGPGTDGPGTGHRGHVRFSPMDGAAIQAALIESAKTDWRPLFSYQANLRRMGEATLDTDSAWVKIARAINSSQSGANFMMEVSSGRWPTKSGPQMDERFFADQNVPQYPWTWSAAVLAGLLVLSSWILSLRVKSLDRLR